MDNHIYEGVPSLPIAEELCKICGHLADDIDELHMRDANGELLTQEDLDYVAAIYTEYLRQKQTRTSVDDFDSDESGTMRDIDFIRDEERGK